MLFFTEGGRPGIVDVNGNMSAILVMLTGPKIAEWKFFNAEVATYSVFSARQDCKTGWPVPLILTCSGLEGKQYSISSSSIINSSVVGKIKTSKSGRRSTCKSSAELPYSWSLTCCGVRRWSSVTISKTSSIRRLCHEIMPNQSFRWSTATAKHSYKWLRCWFSESPPDAICRRMSSKQKRSFASSIGPGDFYGNLTAWLCLECW